jgi:hypothetical protein
MKSFKLYNLDTPLGARRSRSGSAQTFGLGHGFQSATPELRMHGRYHSRSLPATD